MELNGAGINGKISEESKILSHSLENDLDSFVLTNANGLSATILNYGATIASIETPDRNGTLDDILLGHNRLLDFVGGRNYLGATVGRFANRIRNGRFSLQGKDYQLTQNNKGNHLHGGTIGFDKKFWGSKIIETGNGPVLKLTLVSPDGEEGFPGTLEAEIFYSLNDNNELKIVYKAKTDKPTVINLTNHSYFNLAGLRTDSAGYEGAILDHVLMIDADEFTPTDGVSVPTGEIESVTGSPLDFRNPCRIGDRIEEENEQLKFSKGYDQNWVLNNFDGSIREVATLHESTSGRCMHVSTDQPGLQFYSGNYLDGTIKGRNGDVYRMRSGLCLECQHFPNSPNEKNFPSTVLHPGETYTQTTIYRFSTN